MLLNHFFYKKKVLSHKKIYQIIIVTVQNLKQIIIIIRTINTL